jgi:hypothetical protein
MFRRYIEGLKLMDNLKINLPWPVFSEIRDKYPERVLSDIDAGNFYFTDYSVFFHFPAETSDKDKATT